MFRRMGKLCVSTVLLMLLMDPAVHAEEASGGVEAVTEYLSELVSELIDAVVGGPESADGSTPSGDDESGGEGGEGAGFGSSVDPAG